MANIFQRSHLPAVLTLSLFFGTTLVVSRFSLGQFHPFTYVAIRMAIAALLALLWTWLRYHRLPRGRSVWIHGSIVGLFATAAPMLTFVTALQYQSSGVTALFVTLTPISAMIYAHFRLPDERMTTRRMAGALVSFAGVGLLLATGETGLGETHWEGFALVLFGVAANGFGIVHVRKYLSNEKTLDITAVRLVAASLVAIPLAWIVDGYDLSRVQWSGVLAVIYAAVPGALFGFSLYSFLVARFGPSKATQTEYLVPVVTVVIGAILLREHVSPIVIAGMATVFAGIAIATWRRSIPQPPQMASR
jgi:drug/metabolite transporter (DMT)-like permease